MDVVRSVCRSALESRGYRVIEACDGLTALELFEEQAARIVFSLVDVSMPEIGGVELIRKMLALRPDARVAIISGVDGSSLVPVDLAGQCFALNKPFTVAELRALVDQHRHPAAAVRAAKA